MYSSVRCLRASSRPASMASRRVSKRRVTLSAPPLRTAHLPSRGTTCCDIRLIPPVEQAYYPREAASTETEQQVTALPAVPFAQELRGDANSDLLGVSSRTARRHQGESAHAANAAQRWATARSPSCSRGTPRVYLTGGGPAPRHGTPLRPAAPAGHVRRGGLPDSRSRSSAPVSHSRSQIPACAKRSASACSSSAASCRAVAPSNFRAASRRSSTRSAARPPCATPRSWPRSRPRSNPRRRCDRSSGS